MYQSSKRWVVGTEKVCSGYSGVPHSLWLTVPHFENCRLNEGRIKTPSKRPPTAKTNAAVPPPAVVFEAPARDQRPAPQRPAGRRTLASVCACLTFSPISDNLLESRRRFCVAVFCIQVKYGCVCQNSHQRSPRNPLLFYFSLEPQQGHEFGG